MMIGVAQVIGTETDAGLVLKRRAARWPAMEDRIAAACRHQ
jgi:hypothetical protein